MFLSSEANEIKLGTDLSIAGHSCVFKHEISTKEKYQSVKYAEEHPVNEHSPAEKGILGDVSEERGGRRSCDISTRSTLSNLRALSVPVSLNSTTCG